MNDFAFDPDGTGLNNGNYFGFPYTENQSRLVLVSVPWDVTSSYGDGSRYAPDAIIGASTQLDFYDPLYPNGWKRGIGTHGIDYTIQDRSVRIREEADKVIKHLEQGGDLNDEHIRRRCEKINEASRKLTDDIRKETGEIMDSGKLVGIVGGDHSVPLGFIQALAKREGEFSILHIDAHADLRCCYEGFEHSHASIMYNVVTSVPELSMLTQVGIRDISQGEIDFIANSDKISLYSDNELSQNLFNGETWREQCCHILSDLTDKVYISFDIDGLDPSNCPNTGTPVPGGLSYNQAVYLISMLADSGKKIIGFDLCEVSPTTSGEWDANVGARILFKLCSAILKTDS